VVVEVVVVVVVCGVAVTGLDCALRFPVGS
jgi:hypothetical protein